ncbi:hypothetical protein KKG31_05335 [Patescibacteria group bacterium]|nr:hypothetical protein [Patescibacteria group bacterium]MBU1758542.1 hypothetical protein [Patescibacteria group bacterium]
MFYPCVGGIVVVSETGVSTVGTGSTFTSGTGVVGCAGAVFGTVGIACFVASFTHATASPAICCAVCAIPEKAPPI